MSPHRRSLRPMSIALEGVRDELAPQTVLASVQRVWREAVGETIAAEAQPTGERGGTVTVSCSASVWAQELDLMAPAIVARLNQLLDGASIARLRCVSVPSREWS
jgi:predicted nucleic acid-binding Zn ribbon protein